MSVSRRVLSVEHGTVNPVGNYVVIANLVIKHGVRIRVTEFFLSYFVLLGIHAGFVQSATSVN
jgi:hypothetical protein